MKEYKVEITDDALADMEQLYSMYFGEAQNDIS